MENIWKKKKKNKNEKTISEKNKQPDKQPECELAMIS